MTASPSLGALIAAGRTGGLHHRVRLARALAASLAALHVRGDVHGALEPDGVIVEAGTGGSAPSVALAAPRRGGSHRYASPRVLTGLAPTPRDDAYSFGAILAHLMRERPLSASEVAAAAPPPAPGLHDEDAPRVRELVAALLADSAPAPLGLDEAVRVLDATLSELEPPATAGEERIGPFRILHELRVGATGRAVLARRNGAGEDVVLKLARLGEQDACLRHELDALAHLRHPNIVRAHGGHLHERERLFVGEFVRAPGHDGYRRAGLELRGDRIAAFARGLLLALESVHRAGYVHRDVKPSNLVLDDEGRLTLLDFGLVSVPGDSDLTLGSAAFKSPLLFERGSWSHADDVFGALVSLWQIVSGRHPWSWEAPTGEADLRPAELFPVFEKPRAAAISERFRALLARPPEGENAAREALARLDEVLR